MLCEAVKIVAICYTTTENIGSQEVARRQEKAPVLMAKVNFQKEKAFLCLFRDISYGRTLFYFILFGEF